MQEDLSVMRGKLNMGETVRLKVQNKQKAGNLYTTGKSGIEKYKECALII